MKVVIILAILILCVACLAFGFFLGQRDKGNSVKASWENVMPSLRPATKADIADVQSQIDQINRRMQVLASVQTNFIYLVQSNFYLDEQAINNHAAIPRQAGLNTTNEPLSVQSFYFIGSDTTISQVFSAIGPAKREIGSGIYIYNYSLFDGSHIWIGSIDGSHILYVRHGKTFDDSKLLYLHSRNDQSR